ncbi:MAG: hypothetical protein N3F09_00910 [Bacteroidia bacterium]|nr:hypothetical protein [Bacteroidia bacterium]
MKNFSYLFLFLFVLAFISCSGDSTEKQQDTVITDSVSTSVQDTTPVTVSDTTKFKFDFAVANIPSPASIIQEYKSWGVNYDAGLLNDPKKFSTYTQDFQKSINLGVYNLDLAYAISNDKGSDVMQYLKSTLSLADALGIRNAVSAMVGKRAESNIGNKDSLFKILDEIFVKSDTYLRTNDRVNTAALIFTGAWIEGLNLTCKLSEKISDPKIKLAAYKHLWEQRFHLGNIINLLNDFKDKKECSDLAASLKKIHEEITAIKKPEDFKEKEFSSISSKIYALRESLIK